jgi:predicted nucleic acid-binding protein
MRIVNASPLIHLARVALLELLRGPDQGLEVVVPAIVLDEVLRGAERDPTAGLVEAATRDWLKVVPTPVLHPDINPARIDAGEIAVLSIARAAPGSTVVLDDRAARVEADRLGIPKTGTLRLLLEAKEHGRIPSVRIPLEVLRARGMRLSEEVWREVLSLAGEWASDAGASEG